TGLDVEARRALWEGVRAFHAGGGTVVLTSHYLEEIEALARRVVVIGGGRVLVDDTVAAVRGRVGIRRVSLTTRTDLPPLDGLVGQERDGDRLHLMTADADRLVRDLVRHDVPFTDLEVRPTSLEEAFLTLTGSTSAPAIAA
ncbi:MAG TPA: ABC transporter ATP-binding protein, partial [Actinoplanes sp.]